MDLDDYDYLEKAIEPLKPFNDSRDAECKARKKEDEDRDDHSDRRRKSRLSKEARDTRHERYKHIVCSKNMSSSDDGAESSERDCKRVCKKEFNRLSHDKIHDRDRHEHDCRGWRRRDKGWNVRHGEQERVNGWHNGGGWGRGGRKRFRDLETSRGRAGGMDGKHFDKEVESDWWPDGDKELRGSR